MVSVFSIKCSAIVSRLNLSAHATEIVVYSYKLKFIYKNQRELKLKRRQLRQQKQSDFNVLKNRLIHNSREDTDPRCLIAGESNYGLDFHIRGEDNIEYDTELLSKLPHHFYFNRALAYIIRHSSSWKGSVLIPLDSKKYTRTHIYPKNEDEVASLL